MSPFKSPALFIGLRLFFAACFAAPAIPAFAYDPPNFTRPIFDRDGVSLSKEQIANTVDSLMTIAANSKTDSDLKEKAVGLAMRLAPMDADVRRIHKTLSNGSSPPPASGLKGDMVSLWETALELLKSKPTPDDATLGQFLLELSVVANPTPSADQIKKLAEITDYGEQKWGQIITADSSSPSNLRLQELYTSIRKAEKRMESRPGAPPEKGKGTAKGVPASTSPTVSPTMVPGASSDDDNQPVSEIKITQAKVASVFAFPTGPVAAFATLNVREPTTDEASLRSIFTPNSATRNTFEMKLNPVAGDAQLRGLPELETGIRKVFPKWPENKIADVGLENPDGTAFDKPGRDEYAFQFPGALLFESAFTGTPLPDDFVLMVRGRNELLPFATPVAGVKAANLFGKPKIYAVAEFYEGMLKEAVIQNDVTTFVQSNIIGGKDFDQIRKAVFSNGETAIDEAITAFALILSQKPENVTFEEFSRFPGTAVELKPFVEKFPFHLSGRLMLDFGTKPVSQETMIEKAVTQVDEVVKPFADRYKDAINANGGGVIEDLSDEYSDARTALRNLRTTVPAGALAYVQRAEDVIDAMEDFLSLRNKTTSQGEQRHTELKDALREMFQVRQRLGIESPPN